MSERHLTDEQIATLLHRLEQNAIICRGLEDDHNGLLFTGAWIAIKQLLREREAKGDKHSE